MLDFINYFAQLGSDPMALWSLFALTALGTFAGIYVGAIPGLSVTMAVSILISFTYSWDLNNALALMVGVYIGGVYGGSRAAILLNIPGAPASIATTFDGFPLAKLGLAGQAIGVTTVVSVLGGFIGILVLAFAGPWVSEIALQFASRDYLLLAVLGLLLVASLSGNSLAKGVFCAAFGVCLGMVGMDPLTAQPRLTFGSMDMMAGINYVIIMIGFFGVAEALYQLHHIGLKAIKQDISRILPSWSVVKKYIPLSIRTSFIGVIIGALPGTGGDIASLMAYDHARRSVKKPSRKFGEGAYEGLVAPESANNAAVGGAYIPMLTLGMPGDAVTAVFIGALIIHGLNPGPMLMTEHPDMFWFIIGALLLSNIFLLIFGLTGIRIFTKLVEMPRGILLPLIIILSVVGAYAVNNSITDVYWLLGFGIFGYFLKMAGFQAAPIILGAILGKLMDKSWRQAMSSTDDSVIALLGELFTNPISLILTLAIIALLVTQTPFYRNWKLRRQGQPQQAE